MVRLIAALCVLACSAQAAPISNFHFRYDTLPFVSVQTDFPGDGARPFLPPVTVELYFGLDGIFEELPDGPLVLGNDGSPLVLYSDTEQFDSISLILNIVNAQIVSWSGAFTFAVSGDGLYINVDHDVLHPIYYRDHVSAGPGSWSFVSANIECSEENETCLSPVPIPASLWLLLGALGATWIVQRALQKTRRSVFVTQ